MGVWRSRWGVGPGEMVAGRASRVRAPLPAIVFDRFRKFEPEIRVLAFALRPKCNKQYLLYP